MHGFTQRLILQQHICIQKTASWQLFQDALFFYFKIYHDPREATLGCRFRAGFKPAAGGSDLVNVSVGSSSDSQQDLEILLRVPGGDIQSDSVLEVHVEVESQWNSCSVMSRTSHSNLTPSLTSTSAVTQKTASEKNTGSLSLVFTSHTHTVWHIHTFLFLLLILQLTLPLTLPPYISHTLKKKNQPSFAYFNIVSCCCVCAHAATCTHMCTSACALSASCSCSIAQEIQ